MPKRRDDNAPYWCRLRDAEKQLLETALRAHGSIRETARVLGVSPNYIGERVAALKVVAPHVKPGPKPELRVPTTPPAWPTTPPAWPTTPPAWPTTPTPPGPSAFEHSYYSSIADSLVIIVGLFARGADSPVLTDCRYVADLVHRGICAPREAAAMLHRILMQVVYGKPKELSK